MAPIKYIKSYQIIYIYQLNILHSQPFLNKNMAKSRAFLGLIAGFVGLAFEKVGL